MVRKRILADVIRRLSLPTPARWTSRYGTGDMLEMLGKDFEAYGNDIPALAVELCKQTRIPRAFHCDPVGFLHPELNFDLVTMLYVAEHVDDDLGLLLQRRDELGPDEVILVTVPAFQFLWSNHDKRNHHRRRYRKKTIGCAPGRGGSEEPALFYKQLSDKAMSNLSFWQMRRRAQKTSSGPKMLPNDQQPPRTA